MMTKLKIALAAALLCAPCAAGAAELAVPKLHKARTVVHRVHVVHVVRTHVGYYWGHWGVRSGGTARSWYGSTFAFAGPDWNGGGPVLASSPRGIAAIHCSERRPDACLAEPIVAPVAWGGPGRWR